MTRFDRKKVAACLLLRKRQAATERKKKKSSCLSSPHASTFFFLFGPGEDRKNQRFPVMSLRTHGKTVQRSVRKIVLRIAAIVLRSGTHESQVSQHVVVNLGTTYDLITRCM